MTENLIKMFSDSEVESWAEYLDKGDYPHHFETTFAALLATLFSIWFPWLVTEYSIKFLGYFLIPKESYKFIVNYYLPELK